MQWKGPLRVEARRGNVYQLRVGNKLKAFHANLLKGYVRRTDCAADQQPTTTCGDSNTDLPPAHNIAVIEWEENNSENAISGDLLEALDRTDSSSQGHVKMGQQLSQLQHSELGSLIGKYQGMFSGLPGVTDLITHHIRTSDEIPVRAKPYPVPYKLREALQGEVQDMLDTGIIRESRSPYASPVVVVKKRDGTYRVCVDYSQLNKKVEFDPMPMSTAEDLLHKLGGAKYFTKIDLSKGYWQIPVA